jgi:hypothetical protein
MMLFDRRHKAKRQSRSSDRRQGLLENVFTFVASMSTKRFFTMLCILSISSLYMDDQSLASRRIRCDAMRCDISTVLVCPI